MQSKTYSDLLALVQALAGVDNFTTAEQTKILALANRRLYQAFNASQVWPRYIHGAQARPATDNIIAFEYDEAAGVRTTSSATRSATTVTVVCTAAVDFVAGMEVTVASLGYVTTNPNGTVTVTGVDTTTVANDTFTYELDSGTGVETYTGTGTVSPVAVGDIESPLRVWDANPFGTVGGGEYEFYVESDGIHVVNNYRSLGGFWLAYRQQWPGPYLSSATDIPLEFFYYAAHAAYADFLRMDGQIDKALAEEQAAQAFLLLEIDKAESQRNNNAIIRRISTHNSRMAR